MEIGIERPKPDQHHPFAVPHASTEGIVTRHQKYNGNTSGTAASISPVATKMESRPLGHRPATLIVMNPEGEWDARSGTEPFGSSEARGTDLRTDQYRD
jgi:hypothetical protein